MMPGSDVEVVVVGGGAAGIAAARRLIDSGIRALLLEARARLGGRAWTVTDPSGLAIDLGCGWLHSAEHNPWGPIARDEGATIDKSTPPWARPSLELGFPREQQAEFQRAIGTFFARLERLAQNVDDVAATVALDPDCRWNGLIGAVFSYISGAELDRASVKDFDRYEDSGVNWRVVEGYGTIIAAHAAGVPVALDCRVDRIDHSGSRLRIETTQGVIVADQAIVTVPSALIAAETIAFTPALPDKIAAAAGLPLGFDDKLFIALDQAEEFDRDVRVFARTDRTDTGAYQLRPLGRPHIEAYFGGALAAELEAGGEAAFFDFAVAELTSVFGSAFARRIKPIQIHLWGSDPFARGAYSYALPGAADCRQTLAAPVDNRLFFAGEACSIHDFSTAHGGYHTGVLAADEVIAVRRGSK
jgi:monoamine oxidase